LCERWVHSGDSMPGFKTCRARFEMNRFPTKLSPRRLRSFRAGSATSVSGFGVRC
jgi:hypothetical protein